MTDQEINVAIAEACGWTILKEPRADGCACYATNPDGVHVPGILDYCNDLNAMHSAEKVLGEEWDLYADHLCKLQPNETSLVKALLFATARQRAEAFLRTLGKWKEAQ